MRISILFLFTVLFLSFVQNIDAQTFASVTANIAQADTSAVPAWLAPLPGKSLTINGKDYDLYQNTGGSGGYAVRLRGKYFVYFVRQNSDGSFVTSKGKTFNFALSASKGTLYAKYNKS